MIRELDVDEKAAWHAQHHGKCLHINIDMNSTGGYLFSLFLYQKGGPISYI